MNLDFEENITKLITKPEVKYENPPMYISKFRKSVRRASVRGKSAHKTFGIPKVSLNPPTQFLRKKSRIEIKRTDIKHKHYHIPNYPHGLPSWKSQKHIESSENIKNLGKNFKKENTIKVKNSRAKKPRLYFADDRYGNSFPHKPNSFLASENSQNKNSMNIHLKKNLRPKKELMIKKNSELKVQKSTKNIKIEKAGESSKSNEKQVPNENKLVEENMCRYITAEEREELLKGMKKRWEELMKQFQGLPFLTDTPPKIKRKAKMEQDLKQLEKDIDMIERHPHIYVYNDESNH
ncbi:enkurin [Chelonus insularis]|uniref:enkurin n=1 Tax=Chelonus insularis TaxID=460826 RepID=UPI00158EA7CA|nr:enkurin [Chelonus insularis]